MAAEISGVIFIVDRGGIDPARADPVPAARDGFAVQGSGAGFASEGLGEVLRQHFPQALPECAPDGIGGSALEVGGIDGGWGVDDGDGFAPLAVRLGRVVAFDFEVAFFGPASGVILGHAKDSGGLPGGYARPGDHDGLAEFADGDAIEGEGVGEASPRTRKCGFEGFIEAYGRILIQLNN